MSKYTNIKAFLILFVLYLILFSFIDVTDIYINIGISAFSALFMVVWIGIIYYFIDLNKWYGWLLAFIIGGILSTIILYYLRKLYRKHNLNFLD